MQSLSRPLFWSLIVLLLAGCSAPEVRSTTSVDEKQNAAFLWNGFSHEWSYNHRLNRMGDYLNDFDCREVEKNDLPRSLCTGKLFHTGASGTGRDTLRFKSHYTKVVSPEVGFRSGEVVLPFDGPEQRRLRVDRRVEIPVEKSTMAGRDEYVALLNGYDLHVGEKGKAKKVKQFRVWVTESPTYYPDREVLAFKVGGLLNMNCDSIECKQQRNRVRYKLSLHFMLMGHDGAIHTTKRDYEAAYSWNKRDELDRNDVPLNEERHSIKGLSEDYASATVGFQSIDFDLAKKGRYKDHWFVEWVHALRDVEYDPEEGRASFDLDLFFKEWNARTKRKATSIAQKGEAILGADVVLVQFREAVVEADAATGTIDWPGRNRSPVDEKAVWSKELRLEY